MDDDADIIDLILKEAEQSSKIPFDISKYSVDDVLKESEDSILKSINSSQQTPSNISVDDIINSIDGRPNITTDKGISKVQKKETPKEPLIKKEDIVLPEYDNKLDLVDYLEIGLINEKINKNKNSFHLHQHSKNASLKISSLEIEPQLEISKAIFKLQNILITCMMAKGDLIIIGNSIGEIKIYSLKTAKLMRILPPDKANASQVNCIDITDDGLYLIVGHGNGAVAFWDISANSCKLSINNVLSSSCLAVKFYNVIGKVFYLFASDIEGNLAQIVIKNFAFFWRVDQKRILYTQTKNPTYLIKLISFTEEQKQAFPNLTGAPQAVLFGSIQNIQLFVIENEIKRLWIVERPSYIKDNNPPDASIGIGKPPIDMGIRSDTIKPQLLLALSWGKIIYVHMIPVIRKVFGEPTNLGYFINTSQIYRLGFLTNSLIYFFDATKFIKIIDTRQVNIGNVKLLPVLNEPEVPPKNNEAQLDDGRLVDPEIKPQFVQDKRGQQCAFYLHSIVENGKYLHVLGKRTLYNGKLLNWERCLNNLKRETEEDWTDVLTKGIDIYQMKMPALADIPQDDAIRKKILGNYLQKELNQYVIYCMKDKRAGAIFQDDTEDNKYMSTCISKTIEFCIEIESFNYLLDKIETQFETKDYGDLFLAELEPFILCDKIKTFELSSDKIMKIIDLYIKNKNYDMLSHLLMHLNIKSIDNETIKLRCEQIPLLTPLMYIYNHGKDEDYFAPITKLFDQYLKTIDITQNEPTETLYTFFNKSKNISELKNTKQYIGYKILWYIRMCVLGKKFPNDKMDIGNIKYKKAISQMTYWLLTPKVFTVFSSFDPKNYFDILSNIFSEEKLHRILEEASKSKDNISNLASLYDKDNEIENLSPSSLVEFLVNQSKRTNDQTIKLYSYEFVAKSSKLIEHKKQLTIDTAKMLFLSYKHNQSNKHPIVANKTQDELIVLANDIINLICDSNKFTINDYKIMLSQCIDTPFDIVLLFLYKKTNDYHQNLLLYLRDDAIIPQRKDNLFSWINMTLMSLKDKDISEFNKLKTDICNYVCAIGSISVDRLAALVNSWFSDQKNIILMNLDKEPTIQLAYVELLLKDINKDLQENENNIEDERDVIEYILKLHIKLLCKENRKHEVLRNLKKNPLYPLEECLKIVKEHQVLDAMIYLHQQMGASKEALDLSMESLSEIFQKIKINLSKPTNEFSDNIDTMKKKDFKSTLAMCIEVCEHSQKTEEDLWFKLLDHLYKLSGELNEQSELYQIRNSIAFNQLREQLSQDIKDLLDKMTSYVSIKRIINKVTEESNNMRKQQAEFKEFKDLLSKMLASYSNLTEIMESAKQLLTNSILINVNEYIRIKNSGSGFYVKQCSDCKQDLVSSWRNENVLVFYCGHIVHEHCGFRDDTLDDVVCRICRSNEIEDSITGAVMYKVKKNKNDVNENKTISDDNGDNDNVNNNNYHYPHTQVGRTYEDKKEMFRTLREFDKRFHQYSKNLIDNSMQCLLKEIEAKRKKEKEKEKARVVTVKKQ